MNQKSRGGVYLSKEKSSSESENDFGQRVNFKDSFVFDKDQSKRKKLKESISQGKKVIVLVNSMDEQSEHLFKSLIRHFILLRLGVKFGFFENRQTSMEFRFQGEKLTIHPNFRMALVFKNRCDIHKFMASMGEISLGFVRVYAFDDNIDYLLKDTSEMEEYVNRVFLRKQIVGGLLHLWENFESENISVS